MKKILLVTALVFALPIGAIAKEKTMQNTNPSAPAVPEHVMQNSDPTPEQAAEPVTTKPEHVMQNNNPSPEQKPEHVMRNSNINESH